MTDKKTLYLIDGTAYVHRAYHAIRNLSNSRGLPTNATFGFTRILIKLIEERRPEYMVMLFDMKGPTFRHEIFDEYKANRPPMREDLAVQIPYMKKVTEGFNIPVMEVQGYEADDLIGTLAARAEAEGFEVVMVSGDKDLLQLVTETTSLWDPMKDKTVDLAALRKEFGVAPDRLVDVMGFSGDTSDNIPGVPGIGPKTALALVKEFGDMEAVYEQVETITKKKQKENLIAHKEDAFLSRDLVTIRKDAPVRFDPEAFQVEPPNREVLCRLFGELEFRQLQDTFSTAADTREKCYTMILDEDALNRLIDQLKKADIFALDTETTSQNPMQADLVGLSFAVEADEAFYVPCGHCYPGAPEQLSPTGVLKKLQPVLEDPAHKKVGQNIKYDWIILERHGVHLDGVVFDTMVASYLLNPSKRAHGLDSIAMDFLNHKTTTYQEVAGKGKSMVPFDQVVLDKAMPYACEDADITFLAFHKLQPKLADLGLTRLMETVEVPLIPVLKDMEMRGIRVDRDRLYELSKGFDHQIQCLETDIHTIAGEPFNINSPQQLGIILFEKLKLPVQKKTKKRTGYSTDVEVLTTLAERHEMPALILRHRTLCKLKSTYADALIDLIHPDTGRIHTSYNQTVTATGRLSSSEPNLQNIPIRTEEGVEIRRAFVPHPGWTLLAADYSQIELRLLAHYSDDQILLQAFQEEEDIHARTAAEIFQVFPQMVTPDLRRQAKTINFGIMYGMGAFSLSKELGISRKMAATYIDNYFARYKGVKRFIEETIETARKTRQTSTLLGRIRLLPDINSSNRNVRAFAERTAVNTPIQGTAADLIKLAMIQVDRALRERNLKSAMLLTVHDELVFEVPPEELDEVTDLVREIMENVWPDLRVPLKVNVDSGENWAEAH